MAKLTLTDIANLSGNPTSAETAINANNTAIETALENTLSRDGTAPNTMNASIDLNGHQLLNVSSFSTGSNGGVTGSRPASPATYQMYFDTTLGYAIWYDGTNWVNSVGTTV